MIENAIKAFVRHWNETDALINKGVVKNEMKYKLNSVLISPTLGEGIAYQIKLTINDISISVVDGQSLYSGRDERFIEDMHRRMLYDLMSAGASSILRAKSELS